MILINELPMGPQGAHDDYIDGVVADVFDQDGLFPRWSHTFTSTGSQVYKPAEGDSRRYKARMTWYIRRRADGGSSHFWAMVRYLHDGGQSITARWGAQFQNDPRFQQVRVVAALDSGPTLFAGGGTLYRLDGDGDLLVYQHDAYGNFANYSGQKIGHGWGGMRHITAVRDGGIYAVDAANRLRYYHHNGSGQWDDVNGRVIGEGWGFPWVAAGRFGQLYVINAASQLLYYEHDASFVFGRQGIMLNEGWPAQGVFAGGTNCIYCILPNGDLLHYYHNDSLTWAHQQLKIGNGWGDFSLVRSAGAGEIYAVNSSGDLVFYRHDSQHDFFSGSGQTIGRGWGSSSPHGLIPSAR